MLHTYPPGYRGTSDILPLMTLIAVLKTKDAVVMIGDKRGSDVNQNLTYSDTHKKIFRVNELVVIGAAGNSFDCEPIIDLIIKTAGIREMNVVQVAELTHRLSSEKLKEWCELNPGNMYLIAQGLRRPPDYGFLISGLDSGNRPRIFSTTRERLVPLEVKEDHCQIGVTDICRYIFTQEFKESMSVEEAKKLGIKAIVETSKMSAAVSGVYDVEVVQNSN